MVSHVNQIQFLFALIGLECHWKQPQIPSASIQRQKDGEHELFPLPSLPPELLVQIFRLAFIPDKLIVSEREDQVIIHYGTSIPSQLRYQAVADSSGSTRVGYRFRPSNFAICRSIYAELWQLFMSSSIVWQFVTARVAWRMFCPTRFGEAILPVHAKQLIRSVSLLYATKDPLQDNLTRLDMPRYCHTSRLIQGLKANPGIKVLEIVMPWPDWDYDISRFTDRSAFGRRPLYPPESRGLLLRYRFPMAHLGYAARAIANFCWQGMQTRCPLWNININKQPANERISEDRDTTPINLAYKRIGIVSLIEYEGKDEFPDDCFSQDEHLGTFAQQRYGGNGPTQGHHDNSLSSPSRRGPVPNACLVSIDEFFRGIDAKDYLWRDRLLIKGLVRLLTSSMGAERVQIQFPRSNFNTGTCHSNDSSTPHGDMYGSIQPVIVIG